jgi:hypothetical protein
MAIVRASVRGGARGRFCDLVHLPKRLVITKERGGAHLPVFRLSGGCGLSYRRVSRK